MYNDKNRQNYGDLRHTRTARAPIGRSCPTFAERGESISDIPKIDDRIGNRLCDGTLPGNDLPEDMNGCGIADGGWGLKSHPLAMVYSPLQEFHELYTPEKALERGTVFTELDLPFEGYKGSKGGCGLC